MNCLVKTTALSVAFSSIFTIKASAQHCAYDGTEVVVVKVISEGGNTVIPNLKITVLDSVGNPEITSLRVNNRNISDTIKFWQNKKSPDNKRHPEPYFERYLTNTYFWFADDNYVLADGIPIGTRIKIEDIDGKNNGGYFKTKFIDLPKQYRYSLCSHFSGWNMGKDADFVKGYKPLIIKLDKQE